MKLLKSHCVSSSLAQLFNVALDAAGVKSDLPDDSDKLDTRLHFVPMSLGEAGASGSPDAPGTKRYR